MQIIKMLFMNMKLLQNLVGYDSDYVVIVNRLWHFGGVIILITFITFNEEDAG